MLPRQVKYIIKKFFSFQKVENGKRYEPLTSHWLTLNKQTWTVTFCACVCVYIFEFSSENLFPSILLLKKYYVAIATLQKLITIKYFGR